MPAAKIPPKTLYRLSIYGRCLQRLPAGKAGRLISSEALAKAAGTRPAQLRKDLACIGPLGRRGLGYEVTTLQARIAKAVGTNRLMPVVLVGVGNLGAALLSYRGFAPEGFEVVAAFDVEPRRVRPLRFPVPLFPMHRLRETIRKHHVRLAILTVPADAAQEVAQQLVAAGVQGILNFSPIPLHVPESVTVNHVNLAIELENLAYFVR